MSGHLRSRRDESGDGHRRRGAGFRADRGDHGPGAHSRDRHGCLPGIGHRGHHHAHREAQHAGAESGRYGRHGEEGVLHRRHRTARTGAGGRAPRRVPGGGEALRVSGDHRNQGLPALPRGRSGGRGGGEGTDRQRQAAGALCGRRGRELRGPPGTAGAGGKDRHAGDHHLDGPRDLSRAASPVAQHAGHARHGLCQLRGRRLRSDHCRGRALRRSRRRSPGEIRAESAPRSPLRHRPRGDSQGRQGRLALRGCPRGRSRCGGGVR